MGRRHSAGGYWWWDGTRWAPALSRDRGWWFDGDGWQPAALTPGWRPQRRASKLWPAWLMFGLGAWLIALTLWEPVLLLVLAGGVGDARRLVAVAVVVLSIGAVATILWGYALASRRRWRELATSVVAGTVAVLAWYWGAMLADESAGNSDADHAAAAGTVILGIPIAISVALLLGIGVSAQILTSVIRRGHASSG